jgi:serine/threonine-protein kinase
MAMIIMFALLLVIVIQLGKRYIYKFIFWKKKNYISHYKIIGKIAIGGMGAIYKALDMLNKSDIVAIKVLKEEYHRDEIRRQRLKYEAAIIDHLNHPNIVKIISRGLFGDSFYIAMEYLEGKNLSKIIKEEKLSIPIIINIMTQVASALYAIHSKNIIHRDIKPENIMIINTANNPYFVKLLDFGLAKMHELSKLTQTGRIVGTIFYLSPEQIKEKKISFASDLYSFGVIFYELLSGKKPFVGRSSVEIIKKIIQTPAQAVSKYNSEIPESLANMVMQLLRKAPEERPALEKIIEVLYKLNTP